MARKNSKTEKLQTQVPAASANSQQVVAVKQNQVLTEKLYFRTINGVQKLIKRKIVKPQIVKESKLDELMRTTNGGSYRASQQSLKNEDIDHPGSNFPKSQRDVFKDAKTTLVPAPNNNQEAKLVQLFDSDHAQQSKSISMVVTVNLLYALSISGTLKYDCKSFQRSYKILALVSNSAYNAIIRKLFPTCFITHFSSKDLEADERVNFYTAAVFFSNLGDKKYKFTAQRVQNFHTKAKKRNAFFQLNRNTLYQMTKYLKSYNDELPNLLRPIQNWGEKIYDEIQLYLKQEAELLRKWDDRLVRRCLQTSFHSNRLQKHEKIEQFLGLAPNEGSQNEGSLLEESGANDKNEEVKKSLSKDQIIETESCVSMTPLIDQYQSQINEIDTPRKKPQKIQQTMLSQTAPIQKVQTKTILGKRSRLTVDEMIIEEERIHLKVQNISARRAGQLTDPREIWEYNKLRLADMPGRE